MNITDVDLKINFIERYMALSKQFEPTSQAAESWSIDSVSKVFYDLGYEAKYFKNERFFRVTLVSEGHEFLFHAALNHRIVELIIYIKHCKEHFRPSGPFSWIQDEMGQPQTPRIMPPHFSSYEDLAIILEEGLSIYEDVKREFLALVSLKPDS